MYIHMNTIDERIPINITLTEHEKDVCDASYSEMILYLLFSPGHVLNYLCNLLRQ